MLSLRIWHYELLPYLPDQQFRGQLRELIVIMHDWRDKGKTNHLLINKVMKYPKSHLSYYFFLYDKEYQRRYGKRLDKHYAEFIAFCKGSRQVHEKQDLFAFWHNYEYLRICMANLYEKYLASGKNKVTEDEMNVLKDGYYKITGERYVL